MSLSQAVYDASRGVREVEVLRPWLQTIHARATLCPVIVVGTHWDKVKDEQRSSLADQLSMRLQELERSPGFPRIIGQCLLAII